MLLKFLTYLGPILCEFKVKTDNCFPLVAPGKALDDLILHQDMTKSFDLQNQLPPNWYDFYLQIIFYFSKQFCIKINLQSYAKKSKSII